MFDPVTRKRLRRFRQRKRAWTSLWILLALYGLSLASEFVCNDRPLYVRFEGRSFFPAFKYYPEDRFLHDGSQNRPHYRRLNRNPVFADTPGNFMIFAPVPYSPYESLSPDSLQSEARTTLTFTPVPRVGSVDVRPDFTVARSIAAGYFFGEDDAEIQGLCITNAWDLSADIRRAVAARFRNEPAPAVSVRLRALRLAPLAIVSLSEFSPRSHPPQTVRLTFRDTFDAGRKQAVAFAPDGALVTSNSSLWNSLPAARRDALAGRVREGAAGLVSAVPWRDGERAYRVTIEKHEVRWPYPPCRGHWMGVDSAGRDVLARILYGLRTSLSFGLLLVAATLSLGALVGAVQGYFAGKVDITAQRLIEIWSAIPFLYVMILLGSVFGPSFLLLLLCYGLFNWIGVSYYVRAEFLRLRHAAFVESAICMGVPARKVILRHIMPNAITPLVTLFPFLLVGAIASLTALDYLGFGLPSPAASWGEMLQEAHQIRWAWWLVLYPSLTLFIVMLLGVFIGEGVRDAYDPRRFSRME